MINLTKLLFIFIFLFSFNSFSRNIGETEITADEGIEVFQNEKYYLLKKNVVIESDNFNLYADKVKAYFDKDLYDIVKIESEGNAILKSSKGMQAEGDVINFSNKDEIIDVYGNASKVQNNEILMLSNKHIKINNLSGNFYLEGTKSELKTKEVHILGKTIKGKYVTINGLNEIEQLIAKDDDIANFKTEDTDMYALKAIYNKKINIIELFDSVKIIRDGETILGDYAIMNTLDKSYKVKSNNSNKVKILMNNADE